MDAQPPKRRKTSPQKATPVFNRNTIEPASASRASYMSPTRASLSRFNPSLVPQPRSTSARPAIQNATATPVAQQSLTPDQVLSRGQEALSYIMGNFNAQMQRTLAAFGGGNKASPLGTNAPIFATPGGAALGGNEGAFGVPTGEETDEQMEAMRSAIRARKQQERAGSPRAASSARSTPVTTRRQTGSVPPQVSRLGEEVEEDDELSLEIGRNDMPRSRAASVRHSVTPRSAIKSMSELASAHSTANQDIEIDPALLEELQVDELSPDAAPHPPPSRRITSSPAVRRANPRMQRLGTEEDDGLPDTPEAIRRQMEAEDHPPRGVLFSSPSKRKRTMQGSPGKSNLSPIKKVAPVQREKPASPEPVSEPATQVEEETQVPQPQQPDPQLLAKKEEKAKLEAEVRKLKEDVQRFEHFAKIYSSEDGDGPANMKPVLDLLNSSRGGESEQVPEPALSSLLTSFLPFSVPVVQPPKPSEASESDERFVSHEPLKEKDPLPLNSLFTPLSITSTTSVPTPIPSTRKLRQKHTITLSSPSSLLTCSLDMTITSEHGRDVAPSIEKLEVKDLSSWAKQEIGDWVEERCREGDVAAVGYGLGRYWDVAVKRARCWMACRKEFSKFLPDGLGDEEDAGMDEDVVAGAQQIKLSRKTLLPNLGRSSLILQSEDVVLRVPWKMQFDWTGDVESIISADVTLPESWHESDSSDALRKIPSTFDALMREGGVARAVRVVGGLVFDTQI